MRILIIFLTLTFLLQLPVFAANEAPLPGDFWNKPLASQGLAPKNWPETERSLAPEDCGECHTQQYDEWRTSLHAKALSPGLVGQLMTSFSGSPGDCMQCHAPLAEQGEAFRKALKEGQAHVPKAQGLAAAGNSCSGCHVREHKRYGPPQADSGETGQSSPETSHGGVFRSPDFEKSAFCSTCHQFPPSWGTVNNKALENTYEEWKDSPQANKGITCQSCHMPDRKHVWRGIHDPEMTASGLTPTFKADVEKGQFSLANTGVGHAFPTYVTPKAVMRGVLLDQKGAPIKGSEVKQIIQRAVSFTGGRWVEAFDARLFPGQSASLDIPWRGSDQASMWLEIYPDDYYDHQVYDGLLNSLNGEAKKLIAKAKKDAQKSHFRLFETILKRPSKK